MYGTRMYSLNRVPTVTLAALALLLSGFGGGPLAAAPLHAQGAELAPGSYAPRLDPRTFAETVTNPYFPLTPGMLTPERLPAPR